MSAHGAHAYLAPSRISRAREMQASRCCRTSPWTTRLPAPKGSGACCGPRARATSLQATLAGRLPAVFAVRMVPPRWRCSRPYGVSASRPCSRTPRLTTTHRVGSRCCWTRLGEWRRWRMYISKSQTKCMVCYDMRTHAYVSKEASCGSSARLERSVQSCSTGLRRNKGTRT